jgi:hypothetical protein
MCEMPSRGISLTVSRQYDFLWLLRGSVSISRCISYASTGERVRGPDPYSVCHESPIRFHSPLPYLVVLQGRPQPH